jgi:electron transport complex protein RnfC
VRFGTPIRELIDYCGGVSGQDNQIIIGGPMMGISLFDPEFPICKGANCVLVKAAQPVREQDCISCGRCISACPVGLMPTLYPRYVKMGRYESARDNYVESCIECGACAYACPSNIPIVQYVKVAKNELRRRAAKK